MNFEKQNFSHSLNINLIYGIDAMENNLPHLINQEKASKVFIVTDRGIVDSGILEKMTNLLSRQNLDYYVFSEVEPNPLTTTVMKAKELYLVEKCELIIALGGGSSMDLAKAVSAVVGNGGHIMDYRRGKKFLENAGPKIIAVPTTVGTGSEVTTVAVITDFEAKRKYMVSSSLIQPQYAIVDPLLTYTLPKKIVATTGMDALVHAIESYTSNAKTSFSEGVSMQAIKMLVKYLPSSYHDESNHEARAQVHLASTLAGIGFQYGKLGMIHSCSHPMTARHGVEHGQANAVILPYVIQYNHVINDERFAEIARVFDPSLHTVKDREASRNLSTIIHQFNRNLDIPDNFHYLNVDFSTEMIEQLAEDAMNDVGTFPFNPREATKEDVISIYNQVLL